MAKSTNPFRYFDSSPEVIRLVVMMYVKYPLSLRNVEDLLHERGMDLPRDGTAVVEPLRCDVRRRDPKEAGPEDTVSPPPMRSITTDIFRRTSEKINIQRRMQFGCSRLRTITVYTVAP